MVTKTPGQALLENAYDLTTPADSVRYYRDMAAAYDTDFVAELGYDYPLAVAQAYLRQASTEDVPIADIGCGTGAVAACLSKPITQIDGMDISPDMLAMARSKSLYRALYEVDLTGPLDRFASSYGAVLSAGTFTHGHLGPGPLRSLLDIARSGALFVIGVNQTHFDAQNFTPTLDAMQSSGQITPYHFDTIKIYSKPGHTHSNDRALILQYRKR